MRILVPCLLMSLCAPALAQKGPPVVADRVAPPVQLVSGRKPVALLPGNPLKNGNRVTTGVGGRAALRIGAATLTLGGESELTLHSTETDSTVNIARVVLTKGALRVQSNTESDELQLDLRLNVGPLRLRALSAGLWTATEPRGETVCLLTGSVEIAAEFGTEVLDQPGDCLLFSSQNRRLVLKPDTADTLARKLERTAFASDIATGRAGLQVIAGPQSQASPDEAESLQAVALADAQGAENTFEIVEAPPQALPPPEPPAPAYTPAYVPEPQPVITPPPPAPVAETVELAPAPEFVAPLPESPPPVAAPASPPEPALDEPPPPVLDAEGWYVVVASPVNAAAAKAHANRLRSDGLRAAVRSGGGKHRVVVGPFRSRNEAAAERSQIQRRLGIHDAWLLQD